MARYIDADALAKVLFDMWQECDDIKILLPAIRSVIKCSGIVDVVTVVRCKDCKFWKSNYTWNCKEGKVCMKDPFEPFRKEDFFCADGERKSE